jgi:hypothetical protein
MNRESGVEKRAEAEETSASEPPRRESGVGSREILNFEF